MKALVIPVDGEMAVREQERRHVARLVEGRLSPRLNLLVAQANAYQDSLTSPAQARQATRTLVAMAVRALSELHDLVADLDPSDLYDLGLGPALETLALRIEQCYGLDVTLDVPGELSHSSIGGVSPVAPSVSLAAYRIAQEGLHNAGQHAGAGRVGLSVRSGPDGLRLTVADDGVGFQPPEPLEALSAEGKRGLVEIVEWAAVVGGRVEISSVFGVGTQLRAYLPLMMSGQLKPKPMSVGVDEPLIDPLTPREREVLAGVAAGLTNKQVAVRLGISDRTVQFHLGNVLSKLGVASRTEAAVLALQRGLV